MSVVAADQKKAPATAPQIVGHGSGDVVTLFVDGQSFGIPVLKIQDVLRDERVTPVPLARPEIAGSLNLRGRIVTAIDLRRCLGLTDRAEGEKAMNIVIEHDGELYSLVVDEVGDVKSLKTADLDRNPSTLDPAWRDVAEGVVRMDDHLLVVLNVEPLMRRLIPAVA